MAERLDAGAVAVSLRDGRGHRSLPVFLRTGRGPRRDSREGRAAHTSRRSARSVGIDL
jgi:hypothetical protein